jgi:hypothetical protein
VYCSAAKEAVAKHRCDVAAIVVGRNRYYNLRALRSKQIWTKFLVQSISNSKIAEVRLYLQGLFMSTVQGHGP